DRDWTRRVAESFDASIPSVLEPRRDAARRPASDAGDLPTRPIPSPVACRPLADAEPLPTLRSGTGGDLGSIAQCVGVLVHHLATRPALQARLRAGVDDAGFDAVIDEILRIDDPFVSNRRITTCPVDVGGIALPQGAPVKLNWT